MNELKSVYAKINSVSKEVELSSEKVEFAILDNLKKYTTGYSKYFKEGQGLQNRGDRLKEELNDVISALFKWEQVGESIADDMASDLVKFEKATKDLGINPSSSKEYVAAEKAFKSYVEAAKAFNRVGENLRKIR